MKNIKKDLCLIAFTLISFFGMSLSSCENNDDITGIPRHGSIKINGKTYDIDPYITMGGYWDKDKKEGTFTVSVYEVVGSDKDCLYYTFTYKDDAQPKVGDDFANKSLKLEPIDNSDAGIDQILNNIIIKYRSGSAKVVSIEKQKGIIVINFNNLTMYGGKYTYSFDGTVPVDFNYGRTSW